MGKSSMRSTEIRKKIHKDQESLSASSYVRDPSKSQFPRWPLLLELRETIHVVFSNAHITQYGDDVWPILPVGTSYCATRGSAH